MLMCSFRLREKAGTTAAVSVR